MTFTDWMELVARARAKAYAAGHKDALSGVAYTRRAFMQTGGFALGLTLGCIIGMLLMFWFIMWSTHP
jgi:hypothetical protein